MPEIEIITDGGRRRRWTASEKLRIVEETLDSRSSIDRLDAGFGTLDLNLRS